MTRSTDSRRARNSDSVTIEGRRRWVSRPSRRRCRLASIRVEPLTPRTPSSSLRVSRTWTTVLGGSSPAVSSVAAPPPPPPPRRRRRRRRVPVELPPSVGSVSPVRSEPSVDSGAALSEPSTAAPDGPSPPSSVSVVVSASVVARPPRPRRPRRRRLDREDPSPSESSGSRSGSVVSSGSADTAAFVAADRRVRAGGAATVGAWNSTAGTGAAASGAELLSAGSADTDSAAAGSVAADLLARRRRGGVVFASPVSSA